MRGAEAAFVYRLSCYAFITVSFCMKGFRIKYQRTTMTQYKQFEAYEMIKQVYDFCCRSIGALAWLNTRNILFKIFF